MNQVQSKHLSVRVQVKTSYLCDDCTPDSTPAHHVRRASYRDFCAVCEKHTRGNLVTNRVPLKAEHFVEQVRANINNLSDQDFREFVRTALDAME